MDFCICIIKTQYSTKSSSDLAPAPCRPPVAVTAASWTLSYQSEQRVGRNGQRRHYCLSGRITLLVCSLVKDLCFSNKYSSLGRCFRMIQQVFKGK